jgi:hypothetical protein
VQHRVTPVEQLRNRRVAADVTGLHLNVTAARQAVDDRQAGGVGPDQQSHLVSGAEQAADAVRSDVAGSAGDRD